MTDDLTARLREADADRFWALVEPTGFCWAWTGSLTYQGYGSFSAGKRTTLRAHRVAYALLIGTPPALLDHLCRNRKCVNPDHLVKKSNRANVLEGFGPTAVNARKRVCVNGHSFTRANTYESHGHRLCRRCRADAQRRYRERNGNV